MLHWVPPGVYQDMFLAHYQYPISKITKETFYDYQIGHEHNTQMAPNKTNKVVQPVCETEGKLLVVYGCFNPNSNIHL